MSSSTKGLEMLSRTKNHSSSFGLAQRTPRPVDSEPFGVSENRIIFGGISERHALIGPMISKSRLHLVAFKGLITCPRSTLLYSGFQLEYSRKLLRYVVINNLRREEAEHLRLQYSLDREWLAWITDAKTRAEGILLLPIHCLQEACEKCTAPCRLSY